MSFLHKLGIGSGMGSGTSREVARTLPAALRSRISGAPAGAVGANRPAEPHQLTRVSNGLKEFLWNLDGVGRGALLDLGPAWQTTLSFFIERGFRVSSEDIMRGWKGFLTEEEARLREDGTARDTLDMTPAGRATRFLAENLKYPRSSFDAVLLSMFHSKKPEGFQRYRVADSNTLQVIETPMICPVQKIYQNREIQDLFGRFRTMKSFVGRDQLRETLFIK